MGGTTQSRSWTVLRPGGVLVGIAAPPDGQEATRHGARAVFFIVEPDRTGLEAVAWLIEDGKARSRCGSHPAPGRDPRRVPALAQEHHRGKVVIHVAG
ncbi:zinc-binding dehydrogenase [Streptomyces sp. NPDC047085]|uniref:zinc-binding dehydrogenase n=1 Tax=Streptomyces sp. NPDC047085 TaxID=3155140 RepID=UPI003407F669